MRPGAVAVACLAFAVALRCERAHAEPNLDPMIEQLSKDNSRRERIAAALALSKSHDPRAVVALAKALDEDEDPGIRRVASAALEKLIHAKLPDYALQLGIAALANAREDADPKVREVTARAYKKLAPLAATAKTAATVSGPPQVFVNVDSTQDQSRRLPADGGERLRKIVKANVERANYVTSWPGGALPTSAELANHNSRAFIVAPTVKRIEITKQGSQAEIACTVAVRIAPWGGRDGGERWEANRAASASGSAKATTGSRDRDIQGGVRDCIEAVAEDVAARQIVPFLRRIASL